MPLTTLSRAEIEKKVIELAAAQAGVDPAQVTAAHHFRNDLNFDSLDDVELVMSIEDEFHISVPDEAAEKIRVIEDVIRHLLENKDNS